MADIEGIASEPVETLKFQVLSCLPPTDVDRSFSLIWKDTEGNMIPLDSTKVLSSYSEKVCAFQLLSEPILGHAGCDSFRKRGSDS